jgi:hypothetical protein
MNALLEIGNIPPKRFYRLNLCRLYLQVECLSEICTIDGKEILQEIWQGNRPFNSQTKLLWPNQARPREKSWNEWRTVLKDAFLAPNIIRANKARSALPLQQPLGPWMGTRHHTQRQWMHYVSEDGNTLDVKRPTGFHCHTRIPTLFHSYRYQVEKSKRIQNLTREKSTTPIECITDRRSLNTIPGPTPATCQDPTTEAEIIFPTTLQQRMQQLAPWQALLLEHLVAVHDEKSLHQSLTRDNTI